MFFLQKIHFLIYYKLSFSQILTKSINRVKNRQNTGSLTQKLLFFKHFFNFSRIFFTVQAFLNISTTIYTFQPRFQFSTISPFSHFSFFFHKFINLSFPVASTKFKIFFLITCFSLFFFSTSPPLFLLFSTKASSF